MKTPEEIAAFEAEQKEIYESQLRDSIDREVEAAMKRGALKSNGGELLMTVHPSYLEFAKNYLTADGEWDVSYETHGNSYVFKLTLADKSK